MSKAEEDFKGLSSLAERLKLEGDEAENFIGSAMKRLGHTPRTMWQDSESQSKSKGDFFGGGSSSGKSSDGDGSKPWGY